VVGRLALSLAVALALTLPACDRGGAPTREAGKEAMVYHRDCESQVRSGATPSDPGRDLAVGPVTFHGIRSAAMGVSFEGRPRAGWAAVKAVTSVEAGAGATVSVPEGDRGSMLLIYSDFDSSIRVAGRDTGWFPKSAGHSEVSFGPCKASGGDAPAFNGGFLVREPGCYSVEVASRGSTSQSQLGFGVSQCGS